LLKSVPIENKSVEQAEVLVNLLLDDMIESNFPQVNVSGYGSGSTTNPQWNSKANVSFSLTVTPINESL
jgi:hypothetical protein